jgi:hypothetical protein
MSPSDKARLVLDFLNREIASCTDCEDPDSAGDEIIRAVLVGIATQLGTMAAAHGTSPEACTAVHAALVEWLAVGWEVGMARGEKLAREHGGPVAVDFAPEPRPETTRLLIEISDEPPSEQEFSETFRRVYEQIHKLLLRVDTGPRP